MFETLSNLEKSADEIILEKEEDLDGLNYLAGQTSSFVNKSYEGALLHMQIRMFNLFVNIPEKMIFPR